MIVVAGYALLKSREDFRRFVQARRSPPLPPTSYPCFARMQNDGTPLYIYRADALEMYSALYMSQVFIPLTTNRKSYAQPSPAWGRDESGELFIRCKCGLCMGMQHEISPTGEVSPSLFHDDNGRGCGWHVWGILQDWKTAPQGASYQQRNEAPTDEYTEPEPHPDAASG